MARVSITDTSSLASKTGVQNSTYVYAADAGANDSYAITLSPAVAAYAAGQVFTFYANTANTGAASLAVNGLTAKTIKKSNDQDLATGDIEAGQIVTVAYNGTDDVFEMISQTAATLATGDVAGPAASVDNELPLFSGTGGKTLKRSTGTGVVRVDSGVVSIDSDITDLVSAASDTLAGKVELATDAETVTGTDTARAVTPANVTAKMAAPGAIGGTTPAAGTFTTVTVNTGVVLAENAGIALDPAGSVDGKYTGITMTGTGGATIAFGDLLYLDAATSRWKLADADAAATADRMLAIAVTASTDGTAVTLLMMGNIRADAKFPALTIGSTAYVGETPGAIQTAIPVGADNVIRRVGYALTADELYFNPSMDSQITVA